MFSEINMKEVERDSSTNLQRVHDAHRAETATLLSSNCELNEINSRLSMELQTAKQQLVQLQSSLSLQSTSITTLEIERNSLQSSIKQLQSIVADRDAQISQLTATLEQRDTRIVSLDTTVRAAECMRRKLHNDIQVHIFLLPLIYRSSRATSVFSVACGPF